MSAWISVKDDSHKVDKRVLIFNSEGIEVAVYSEAEEDAVDFMGHDAGWIGDIFASPGRSFGNRQYPAQGQPTHWMELPAPPEGEL